MSGWTIAGLAREGGVGVETVRYYQRRGLLTVPERVTGGGSAGRVRRYGPADVRRLAFIRSAKAAGFTLETIGELLALDASDDRAKARRLALERVRALDEKIAEMQVARDALASLAAECEAETEGPCPILLAFGEPGSAEPQDGNARCSAHDGNTRHAGRAS
ncbi:MerR family DNA-binding protein [Aureimonas sp. ME7]|uniref:MerR family DNA-binding protein n=1 Tax=Aureimonas sp. ME7 TaxID=2744252 RepID=UPI0015F40385|nr:MerR family DNA-binding protein [Aureimonas sp. ME7]